MPIDAATVTILQTTVHVETTASGRFKILQVPPGQYLVIVRRLGYRPSSGIVDVSPNETVRLAYTLERVAMTLDTTHVIEQRLSMRMAEFEGRRRFGVGQFLTQDQIERRNTVFTTELVRTFVGIKVVPILGVVGGYRAMSARVGRCPTQIFIDGVRLPDNPPQDLDLLPSPKDLAGMELYTGPATAPPQYAGNGTRCGVLLLWTKDGS